MKTVKRDERSHLLDSKTTNGKRIQNHFRNDTWCRLWIYNYGLIIKPLYELLKDKARQLIWTREAKRTFEQLKRELMRAPALGLPNVLKPF